jgi:hypothetical protein
METQRGGLLWVFVRKYKDGVAGTGEEETTYWLVEGKARVLLPG